MQYKPVAIKLFSDTKVKYLHDDDSYMYVKGHRDFRTHISQLEHSLTFKGPA